MQLLEGAEATVRELYYGPIARDLRYRHLHMLADGPLTARTFTGWHMGFLHTSPASEVAIDGYLNPAGAGFLASHAPAASPVLLNLLHQFVHTRSGPAAINPSGRATNKARSVRRCKSRGAPTLPG